MPPPLCEACQRAPAVVAALPKRTRHQDTEPEPVALCWDDLRRLKTVEGRISSYRLLSETADPQQWGM